ncbi:MAG: hypothetical protein ABMB14_29610, partial [Myxococcota bacterium]
GGERLGYTPYAAALTGAPTDPPRRFEIRKRGYVTRTFEQAHAESPVEAMITLVPVTPAAPAPPAPLDPPEPLRPR